MKKKILVLITLVLTLACALCASALIVSAEESAPSVSIEKFNLAFEDNTYLKYAVKFTGVDDAEITKGNIGMLYWTDYERGFVPGTEDFSSETTGYTTIDGVKHYVFEYTHLAAKQLTDYIYSVAYLEYNGETYYSEPVKYSALEYAYNRLGKTSEGTTNEELKSLLNNMLAYGASAQQYFDYKEDRLATADFYQLSLVGGTLDDGFASGLYLSTDKVTITAPEDDGKTFAGWKNSAEEIVYTDNPATVENLTANTTLTAAYEDAVKYSEGLEFVSNGDGTCYVNGIGTCTDADIVIPPVSPDGETVIEIGMYAFSGCDSIMQVVLPESTNIINDSAFFECLNLESIKIPTEVTRIGSCAFLGCENLKTIELPNNLTSIEYFSFHRCIELKDITIPSGVNYIEAGAFSRCQSLTSVEITDLVTSIGEQAFANCDNLTNVIVPNSVTYLGDGVFYNCPKLQYNLYNNALYLGNTSNPYVVLMKANATTISSCYINADTKFVDTGAFSDCFDLKSVTIPENLISIGINAFSNCITLSDVHIKDITQWCSIIFGSEESNPLYHATNLFVNDKIITDLVIPEGVTSIPIYAFSSEKIATIKIPNSVINIDDYAFYGCKSLTNIDLPNSVVTIGYYSFKDCTNLESVSLPVSISTIGYNAFENCTNLEKVNISDLKKWCTIEFTSATSNPLYYAQNLYVSNEIVQDLIIPNEVTKIGKMSFVNCTSITSVTIGDDLLIIGSSAFLGCTSLKSIKLGDNIADIENHAFKNCSSLDDISLGKNVKTIGNYAFHGCSSLKHLTITANITYIGMFAFLDCISLMDIVIQNSLSTIDTCAFLNCNSLKNVYIDDVSKWCKIDFKDMYSNPLYYASNLYVNKKLVTQLVIPDSITKIPLFGFSCENITEISISDKITSIETGAFSNCTSLKNVTLGSGITQIEHNAFSNSSIENVYFKGTEDAWDMITISYSNDPLLNATRYYYSETEPTTEGNFWHYVDGVPTIWS